MNESVKTLFKAFRRKKHKQAPVLTAEQRRAVRVEALRQQLPDAQLSQVELIQSVETLTMTSPERLLALIEAVNYLDKHSIDGDIVECGVWRGGSMATVARTLLATSKMRPEIWLYDTFEGMSEPTSEDVDFMGQGADQLLSEQAREDQESIWCYSPIDQVRDTMSETGYPDQKIHFVVGKVEETLPVTQPGPISLLRLDTDWYESTKIELEILFPKIVDGGVLIIDDYGHWEGCRRAVDEYIEQKQLKLFLNRIDYTGRMAIVRH